MTRLRQGFGGQVAGPQNFLPKAPRTFGEWVRLQIGRALLWLIRPAQYEREAAEWLIWEEGSRADELASSQRKLAEIEAELSAPSASALRPDRRKALEATQATIRARLGMDNPSSAAGVCHP